jgi:polyhydroxyalkanoate synthesis regulator phasin
MEKIKSLADQLREKMVRPGEMQANEQQNTPDDIQGKAKKKADKIMESTILKAMIAYDNSDCKSMAHIRLDKQTLDLLNKFKMATNVDVTKFVAFAVKHFIDSYPELKTIIKQFIQNTDL